MQANLRARDALPCHCSNRLQPPEGSNINQIFHLDLNVDAHSLIICKVHYYKLFLSPPLINEQIPRGNADISKYRARKGNLHSYTESLTHSNKWE